VKSIVVYRDELAFVVNPTICSGEGGRGLDPELGAQNFVAPQYSFSTATEGDSDLQPA